MRAVAQCPEPTRVRMHFKDTSTDSLGNQPFPFWIGWLMADVSAGSLPMFLWACMAVPSNVLDLLAEDPPSIAKEPCTVPGAACVLA